MGNSSVGQRVGDTNCDEKMTSDRGDLQLGFLEEDTPVSVDWLTPKVYKGSTEEETEEDLS